MSFDCDRVFIKKLLPDYRKALLNELKIVPLRHGFSDFLQGLKKYL